MNGWSILSKLLEQPLAEVVNLRVALRRVLYKSTFIFNVIDYANCKNIPVGVLSVDLSKAFDSLLRKFIFAMLKRYGFGNTIINWIKM